MESKGNAVQLYKGQTCSPAVLFPRKPSSAWGSPPPAWPWLPWAHLRRVPASLQPLSPQSQGRNSPSSATPSRSPASAPHPAASLPAHPIVKAVPGLEPGFPRGVSHPQAAVPNWPSSQSTGAGGSAPAWDAVPSTAVPQLILPGHTAEMEMPENGAPGRGCRWRLWARKTSEGQRFARQEWASKRVSPSSPSYKGQRLHLSLAAVCLLVM